MTAGWYDEDYRRKYEAIAAGLVYVSTVEESILVRDVWVDGDRRPSVVVSVRRGVSWATAEPFLEGWDALAWECDPEPDPRARLMEALLQGHLRARERMTGETGLAPLPRQ